MNKHISGKLLLFCYFSLFYGDLINDIRGTKSHDHKMATLDIKLKKANKVYKEGVRIYGDNQIH